MCANAERHAFSESGAGDDTDEIDTTGRQGARYLSLLDIFATRVLQLITGYRKGARLPPIVALVL